jgi:hypothetical protein
MSVVERYLTSPIKPGSTELLDAPTAVPVNRLRGPDSFLSTASLRPFASSELLALALLNSIILHPFSHRAFCRLSPNRSSFHIGAFFVADLARRSGACLQLGSATAVESWLVSDPDFIAFFLWPTEMGPPLNGRLMVDAPSSI